MHEFLRSPIQQAVYNQEPHHPGKAYRFLSHFQPAPYPEDNRYHQVHQALLLYNHELPSLIPHMISFPMLLVFSADQDLPNNQNNENQVQNAFDFLLFS